MSRTTSYASGSRFSTSVIARARARLSPARTPAASVSRVHSRRAATSRIVVRRTGRSRGRLRPCSNTALRDGRADCLDRKLTRDGADVLGFHIPAGAVGHRLERVGREVLTRAPGELAAERFLARRALGEGLPDLARRDRRAVAGDLFVGADAGRAGVALRARLSGKSLFALRTRQPGIALRALRSRESLVSLRALRPNRERARTEVGSVERAVLHLGSGDGVRP